MKDSLNRSQFVESIRTKPKGLYSLFSQRFSQTHSEVLSTHNEIVKQLVWNSKMKGLAFKVKLIYFMSAWSQSYCSVIFWECVPDARRNGRPN